MTRVYIDFETRSEIDLKKYGLANYATDFSTTILCMAYAIDDGPVQLWLPGNPFPAALLRVDEFSAWNAQFEIEIWSLCAPSDWPRVPPLHKWNCTMALAQSFALPGELGEAGAALKLAQQKDWRGSRLISLCCSPNKKTGTFTCTQQDMNDLYAYCKQDVIAERAIHHALPADRLDPNEHAYWRHQMRQNSIGFGVDVEFAKRVAAEAEVERKALEKRAKALMRGVAPTQRAAVLAWLRENGFEDENLKKLTLEKALKTLPPGPMRDAIEIRLQSSKTSTAKYQRLIDLEFEGSVFYSMTYHGASTGRVTHKGFQPGNLPRGNIQKSEDWLIEHPEVLFDRERLEQFYPPMEVYSALVRSCIVQRNGKLMAGDYAQIEARMNAYMSGQKDLVDLFRAGVDVYKHMASMIYGVSVDEVTDAQRFVGKEAVLGAGYGMGHKRFLQHCRDKGSDISAEDAELAIRAYRETNYKIVQNWYATAEAAKNAVRTPGVVYRVGLIAYKAGRNWLACRLPSGRKIWYLNPRLEMDQEWGEQLRCDGMNGFTHKWETVKLWHGTLVENIVQGACRDIMVDASLRLEKAGMPVVLSVHDELICDVTEDKQLSEFVEIMSACPDWCKGLPIKVGAWEHERYGKR